MTIGWPRLVIGLLGLLTLGFGAANLLARNWLWGDAGYSVEARQPIMFLGVAMVALGLASVRAASIGSRSQQRQISAILLALSASTPLIMTLNIAGWDRLYNDTGWPLIYIAIGFAVLIATPSLLAYLAIRKTEPGSDQPNARGRTVG